MEINLNNVRLLVESTPGMGDLIMLTPALRELKNQFPECEITIMSHPGNLKWWIVYPTSLVFVPLINLSQESKKQLDYCTNKISSSSPHGNRYTLVC